jgi:hypothetical protein
MTELSIELLKKVTNKLKEYEVPPVTRAQLTRDAFMYGEPLIPIDGPSYMFFYDVSSKAELTRDWFLYGVYG